jgi:hypothetical protein
MGVCEHSSELTIPSWSEMIAGLWDLIIHGVSEGISLKMLAYILTLLRKEIKQN